MTDERRLPDDDAWRSLPPQQPVAPAAPGRDAAPWPHPPAAGVPQQGWQPAAQPPVQPPAPWPGWQQPPAQFAGRAPHAPVGVMPTAPYRVAPAPGSAAPAWALEEPQPLPYHRMARIDWRVAQWWRPLATLGVGLGLSVVAMILWGIAALVWDGLGLPAMSENLDDGDNPVDLLYMLGTLATLVPVVVLASWWGAGRRGSIHSVFGRFRWGLLAREARVIVPVYALVVLAPALLFGRDEMTVPAMSGSLVAAYVVIILVAPLQCAGEEYLFRGMPQQALGTWLKSPLWGIILPVPLFMLGHGYDWVGQIDIGYFALCMGALVWRSGGLELPILIHAANNTMSFLLAPLTPGSLDQGAVEPWALAFSLPLILCVTAWSWWWVGKQYGVDWKTPVRRLPGPQTEKVSRWL